MAHYPEQQYTGISGSVSDPCGESAYKHAISQQKASLSALNPGPGCSNSLVKDVDPGLSSEADQLANLSGILVSLVNTVRGHLDPNFGMTGQAQSNSCPDPPAHLRYQLSTAIGNTNHTIEQLRLILDIVSR